MQIGNGKRFAIKTIGDFPSSTNNIWSKDIATPVGYFLIVWLDRQTLRPWFVYQIASCHILNSLKR